MATHTDHTSTYIQIWPPILITLPHIYYKYGHAYWSYFHTNTDMATHTDHTSTQIQIWPPILIALPHKYRYIQYLTPHQMPDITFQMNTHLLWILVGFFTWSMTGDLVVINGWLLSIQQCSLSAAYSPVTYMGGRAASRTALYANIVDRKKDLCLQIIECSSHVSEPVEGTSVILTK